MFVFFVMLNPILHKNTRTNQFLFPKHLLTNEGRCVARNYILIIIIIFSLWSYQVPVNIKRQTNSSQRQQFFKSLAILHTAFCCLAIIYQTSQKLNLESWIQLKDMMPLMLSDKCGIYLQLPIFIFNYCQFVSFNKFKQGVFVRDKTQSLLVYDEHALW